MILSPSILSADFSRLEEEIKLLEKGGCQYVHIDVMDGHFVPNISFGVPIIKSIRSKTDLIFDVHLMISNPSQYIGDFAKAGSDIITIHEESNGDTRADLEKIRSFGKRAGLTIKPKTPVENVYPYLELLDQVLIMSVEPGFGGQKFMPESLLKARRLKEYADCNNFKINIEIDGGINKDNLIDVLDSGVNVIVAGSSIFQNEKTYENINDFFAISKR